MLLHGDELGRTQGGNNNAYCQDNEISWVDWSTIDDWICSSSPATVIAAARASTRLPPPPLLHRRPDARATACRDIAWFTPGRHADGRRRLVAPTRRSRSRSSSTASGITEPGPRGEQITDDSFLLLFNAGHEDVTFTLPGRPYGEALGGRARHRPTRRLHDGRRGEAGDRARRKVGCSLARACCGMTDARDPELDLPAAAARRLRLRRRGGDRRRTSPSSASPTSTCRRSCRPRRDRRTATTSSTTRASQRRPRRRATGSCALARPAHEHGLGIVVDIVPEPHGDADARAISTRRCGRCSATARSRRTAHWFDVDWELGDGTHRPAGPGQPLDEVLAEGELSVGRARRRAGAALLRPRASRSRPGTDTSDVDDAARAASTTGSPRWRDKDSVLDYRRFFDVDTLVAVRVELPRSSTPPTPCCSTCIAEGVIDGLRIDHPDGLADPQGYLERLRDAHRRRVGRRREDPRARRAAARRLAVRRHDRLRRARAPSRRRWSPPAGPELDARWQAARRRAVAGASRARAPSALVVAQPVEPEVQRLTRAAVAAARGAQRRPDDAATRAAALRRAARRTSRSTAPTCGPASQPTPRTLARLPQMARACASSRGPTSPTPSTSSSGLLGDALERRRRRPRPGRAVPAGLRTGHGQGRRGHHVLPLAPPGRAQRGRRRPALARRTRAPTRCTRGPRDQADRPSARHDDAVDPRHQAQRGRPRPAARSWPRTSTAWDAALARLSVQLAAGVRRRRAARRTCSSRRSSAPGRSTPSGSTAYLEKAIREAKQHTTWTDPDARYEQRVRDFAARCLDGDVCADARSAWWRRTHRRRAARSRWRPKLVQLTLPGRAGRLPGQRARRPVAGRPRQPAAGRLRAARAPTARARRRPARRTTSTTRSSGSPPGAAAAP